MNNHFVLFSNCFLVKGANRSLIADHQRHNIELIPDILAEIIEFHQGKTIDEIKTIYGLENAQYIDEYFQFLIEKELVFFTARERVSLFPPISNTWEYPGLLTNVILDYGSVTSLHFDKILQELEIANCHALQLRFFEQTSEAELECILELFNGRRIKYIDLLMIYNPDMNEEFLRELFVKFTRIGQINIFGCQVKGQIISNEEKRDFRRIYFNTASHKPEDVALLKRAEDFPRNNNLNVFTESQHFNTYFNKKAYIDGNGNLKNAPHTQEIFGNIQNKKLIETVKTSSFQRYWNIKKDIIEVCKDCEFRHVCIDPRIPIKKTENEYYFETSCNYDPYATEWKNVTSLEEELKT
jgi:SPASM domain peptide maturase of grasp-with-spasm system